MASLLLVGLSCSSGSNPGYGVLEDPTTSTGGTGPGATQAVATNTTANGVSTSGGIFDASATTTGATTTDPMDVPIIDGCNPDADETDCVGEQFEAENLTLDIYVMFDLSCSMSCSVDKFGCCRDDDPVPLDDWRIQPVREAMRAFLQDPESAGIGVGLGFFGDHPVAQNHDPLICTVDNHSDASVPVDVLPNSAPALIAALDAGEPQGGPRRIWRSKGPAPTPAPGSRRIRGTRWSSCW